MSLPLAVIGSASNLIFVYLEKSFTIWKLQCSVKIALNVWIHMLMKYLFNKHNSKFQAPIKSNQKWKTMDFGCPYNVVGHHDPSTPNL